MLAVGTVAAGAATGGAAEPAAPVAPFQVAGTFDTAGNPVPIVESYPEGAASSIRWSLCPPPGSGACHAIRSTDGDARPGPQPAGTVFKVTATYKGHTYSSSETWHGRVRSAARPVLHGHARFGAVVTGRAARWTGGWATVYDQLGIEACRTRRGTNCVMLSGEQIGCGRTGPCGSEGGVVGSNNRSNRARVGNWFTGWYLFALDAHLGTNTSLLVGYSSPAAIPPWPINATVIRSRPYGPVTGPPPPHIHFLPHAQKHGNRVVVASARCAVRCRAHIFVSLPPKRVTPGQRGGWVATEAIKGSATLGVQGSIPPGRIAVTIKVGDGPYLHHDSLLR